MRNFRETLPSNSEPTQPATAPSLDPNEVSKATTSATERSHDETKE
jgi:hypothetical protein